MYNLGARYRRDVTRQYLRLPLSWHHRHPSGQLSNANADVEATWNVFAPLPMAIGSSSCSPSASSRWSSSTRSSPIGSTVFPMLFVANVAFQRAMSPRVTRAQQLRADVSEVAHEGFEAALIVKSLGREDHETDRFRAVTNELRDANIEVGRTRGRFDPAIEAIHARHALALLIGTLRVQAGELSAAEVTSDRLPVLDHRLPCPCPRVGARRAAPGRRRLAADLGARCQRRPALRRPGAAPRPRQRAHDGGPVLRLRDRDRGGGVGLNPAVVAMTLDIPAGSTIAFVGPTGGGKSTLTNLEMRPLDPDSGAVPIDDVDLRQVRRGGVSEVAALVAQQTFMFDDTVRGNVTLGADHDDGAVARPRGGPGAAFVGRLAEQLDTRVGERGASLSGGQRRGSPWPER